jgi:hypothetical protein
MEETSPKSRGGWTAVELFASGVRVVLATSIHASEHLWELLNELSTASQPGNVQE